MIQAAYQKNLLNQYEFVSEVRADGATSAAYLSYDADGNPKKIKAFAGDMNCDGAFNNFDIDNFVLAIINNSSSTPPSGWTYGSGTAQECWDARVTNGDANNDGLLNNFDIDLFSDLTVNAPSTPHVRLHWDAENRLTGYEPYTGDSGDIPMPIPGGAKKVEFKYDYLGRRVERTVYTRSGSPASWVESSRYRYVYDGWNLIEELNVPTSGDPTILRQYSWGLDLSGQSGDASVSGMHGAGGIGGLLACLNVSDSKTYAYCYDGNGNVGQLVEMTSPGSSVAWGAKYEYDPYGNRMNAAVSGEFTANPFRFSTKFFDIETGFSYYGERYYSARLGRWTSRDPIAEKGGVNLYEAQKNAPTNYVDFLGHFPFFPHPGKGRDAGTCCRDAKQAGLDNNDAGRVICCDGKKVACAWNVPHTGQPIEDFPINLVHKCLTEHELNHFDDVPDCTICPPLTRPGWKPNKDPRLEECKSYQKELGCLRWKRLECRNAPDPKRCREVIDFWINDRLENQVKKRCTLLERIIF